MRLFDPIIKETETSGAIASKPRDFKLYAENHNFLTRSTAEKISVDSFNKLPPELVESKYMVLRLGKNREGNSTGFSIVKWVNGPSEYFLFDEQIFSETNHVGFIPDVSYSALHCFTLIPNFTESSAVNLGLASGLFKTALNLEDTLSIPATGQSTYSFSVNPNSAFEDVQFEHNNGQVEIDAVFSAKRGGRDCIFVVEAKASNTLDSLAKHKLAYSFWAIRKSVPEYLPIIPVYVRVVKTQRAVRYYVAECEFDGKFLNSLTPISTSCFELPKGLGL